MMTSRARTLTLQTLIDKDACQSQVDLFRQHFGPSVEVTEALCVKHARAFDWPWAARNLLSVSAEADYERVRAAAWADYRRANAPAWAEYARAIAPAWADYERATAPAVAEYKRVRAAAWARAYINDTQE